MRIRVNRIAKEEKIFTRFATQPSTQIDTQSIEKRNPPEPDILCKDLNGVHRAFELVEIVDEGLMASIAEQQLLEKTYSLEVKKIPSLLDASIGIHFHPDASRKQKRRIMPDVMNLLKSAPSDFTGEIDIPKNMTRTVQALNILSRWEGYRDNVIVGNARSIGDPLWHRIREKLFEKKYETTHPMELLAYHDLQSSFYNWSGELQTRQNDLIQWLKQSTFMRIWLYDFAHDQILLTVEK